MSAATRSINKPLAIISALTLLFAVAVFSDTRARANHGTRTLDVSMDNESSDSDPDSSTQGVGTVQVLTATLSSPSLTDAFNIDFENENGPNDKDDSNSPTSPDETCSIPAGSSSCSIPAYQGRITGTDTWRAWIDHDGSNATTESDAAEGRDETTSPGIPRAAQVYPSTTTGFCPGAPAPAPPLEPDCTDVVENNWTAGGPTALDCDDAGPPDTERETNPSGGGTASNENYVCTTTDQFGNRTGDANPNETGGQTLTVKGEVETGANDPDPVDGTSHATPDYQCDVDPDPTQADHGQCTITVTQNELEDGIASICFWVGDATQGQTLCANEPTDEDSEINGSDTAGDEPTDDLADRVEKTWAPRAASSLDAEQETDTNNFGDQHTITVTVYDQFGATFTTNNLTVKFEFFQGSPSDPNGDGGNTPSTPDKSCSMSNSSSCTMTYTQSTTAGLDRLCVWINSTPNMVGDNNTGTCDGESLTDADDAAGTADPPTTSEDDVDVVEKRWNNPNATPSPTPSQTTSTSPSPSPTVSGSPSPSPSPTRSTTPSPSPTPSTSPTPKPQCSDGADNDGDGQVDLNDPGCSSSTDTSESPDPFVPAGCRNRDGGENVMVGTNGADVLVGTSGRDVICGAGGDDVISGRDGNDLIQGNGGADTIGGGGGKDNASGNGGNDTVSGNKGNDAVKGQGGNDTLKGNAGIDTATGGDGGDSLQGGGGGDILKGGADNDSLRGGAGDDQLDGGAGKDQCSGNDGSDNINNCE